MFTRAPVLMLGAFLTLSTIHAAQTVTVNKSGADLERLGIRDQLVNEATFIHSEDGKTVFCIGQDARFGFYFKWNDRKKIYASGSIYRIFDQYWQERHKAEKRPIYDSPQKESVRFNRVGVTAVNRVSNSSIICNITGMYESQQKTMQVGLFFLPGEVLVSSIINDITSG